MARAGLAVDALRCDVTRREEVFALRDAAIESTGRLDLWVNNAGRAGAFGPVRLTPESDFLATTDTVIRGTYFGSLAALDAMVPKGAGDLINLLGRGDDGPVTNQAAYGSAKTWVRAFTRALASEQKGSGVRVHAFNPGLVRTDMLGRIDAVRGFGQGLERFPSVVAALGLDPDEAAEPLLGLIGSDRVEYRGTEPARLLSAALGNLRHRLKHGRSARQPIELTEVQPRSGDSP
ncbi:MAG: SDR family oxidoreductase [Micropruina sp.]|nr:SDR family oxidoreductase [Micropruina sp.]